MIHCPKGHWLLLLLGSAVPAQASAGQPMADQPILLQSHVGPPAADAQAQVARLTQALGRQAPLHGVALARRIEQRLSRPAGATGPLTLARRRVENGRRLFIEGEFANAIAELQRARELLVSRAARVVLDQTLRATLHRTLMLLAHAYLRTGQRQRARTVVQQAVRSFPGRDPTMLRYGPDLVAFYKQTRRELDRRPRGTLTVATQPEKCLVFLDGRFVGLSPTKVVDLYPGRYRVFIQRPREPGRIHLVEVDGNDGRLAIDFALDRRLRTRPFVGLQLRAPRERQSHEGRLSAAIARALQAPLALVVSFGRRDGRRVMRGRAVDPTSGRLLRSAMVALAPAPDPRTLRALGLFLLAGKPGAGLIAARDLSAPPRPRPAPRRTEGSGFFSARVFKWVTLATAVASLAAGTTLLVLDGRGTCDAPAGGLCPESYHTLLPGVVLTAAGGLSAVGSTVLFIWDARHRSQRISLRPWVDRQVAGLHAGWRF